MNIPPQENIARMRLRLKKCLLSCDEELRKLEICGLASKRRLADLNATAFLVLPA